jgi:hypothetical protein
MPLPPPPVPREELHLRQIELRGYRRNDGLYEIDARVTDTKSQPLQLKSRSETLPAGAPPDASPHPVCPEATASLAQLKGLRIGAGFGRIARERLSRAQGCTHLNELLIPLASTAFQTLSPVRNANPDRLDKNGRPLKIDSCYAYASTRELVRVNWPAFHK